MNMLLFIVLKIKNEALKRNTVFIFFNEMHIINNKYWLQQTMSLLINLQFISLIN